MLLQRKAVRDAHVNEILHAYRFALSARTSKVEFDIGLCDWYYKFTRRGIYFSFLFSLSLVARGATKIGEKKSSINFASIELKYLKERE